MANSEDILLKVSFDDSEAVKGLNNLYKEIGKTEKGFDELTKSAEDVTKVVGKDLVDANDKANKVLKESETQIAKNFTATNKLVSSVKLFGIDLGAIKQRLIDYKNNLVGVSKEINIFSGLSFTQRRGVVELSNALGGGKTAFLTIAKAVNVFKLALISTGIGALVVALGGLIAYFTKTQSGIDKVSRAMSSIGAIVDVVIDKFSDIGEVIVKAFDNPKQAVIDLFNVIKENLINRLAAVPDFFVGLGKVIYNSLRFSKEGFQDAGEAAKDAGRAMIQFTTGLDVKQQKAFGDEISATANKMKEAAIQAANLEGRKQKLRDSTRDLAIEESKYRAEIAKNKLISEDTTNDYKTRIEAAKKALGLEQSLLSKKLKLAQEEANIIRANQKLSKNLTSDNDELATAEIKVSQLRAESTEKQIELNNKLNGLVKEAKDKFIQLGKQVIETGVQLGLLTKKDAFDFIKKEQIQNFELLKEELLKIKSIATGEDLETITKQLLILDKAIEQVRKQEFFEIIPFDTKENDQFNIDRLLEQVDKRRAIQKREILETALSEEAKQELLAEITLRGELERLQILQQYGEKETLEYEERALRIQEITNKLTPEIPELETDDFWSSVDDFQSLLDATLKEIFGKGLGEDIGEFLEGAYEAVSPYGKILNEATQIQIENIDKQLNKLSERREKTQEELEKELEFQKEGLANNVGNKQAEVDGLLAQEERLLAERDKLQKESQRRQLVAETATQTASLITSSIDIIKGFSKIPIIGLPLGIAAVASLFGFFAATKAKAFQATKLYTGANRIDDHFGQVAPNGRSDIPGRGEGYRVIDAVTGQDTNVRISGREMLLPESVTDSQREFWQGLKAGNYNDIDIAGVLELHKMNKKRTSEKSINPIINTIVNVPKKQWVSFTDKRGRQGAKLMDIPQNGTEIVYFDL